MQKHSNPSSFLENNTGDPHGKEKGCIAPASNNYSSYFLINNYSGGLCWYIDFHMGSAPSSRDISCTSTSFQLYGAPVGSVPGNNI